MFITNVRVSSHQTMKKAPSLSVKNEKQSRNLKNINTEQFKTDLKNKLEIMQGNVNIEEMSGNYKYYNIQYRKTCPYIEKEMYKEATQIMV